MARKWSEECGFQGGLEMVDHGVGSSWPESIPVIVYYPGSFWTGLRPHTSMPVSLGSGNP